MSSPTVATTMAMTPDYISPGGDISREAPRTFWQQVTRDTFRRAGAKLGAIWVAILAFCGVFAPFLANSHPLLLKTGGKWSSPLLRHLTPASRKQQPLSAAHLRLLELPHHLGQALGTPLRLHQR